MCLHDLGNTVYHCRNIDFIVGTAAEIKRLQSIADKYVNSARNNTTLLMFEAMIFYDMIANFGMRRQL